MAGVYTEDTLKVLNKTLLIDPNSTVNSLMAGMEDLNSFKRPESDVQIVKTVH